MEVVRRVVLCCACLLALANVAAADGFFRRLPEVGEWARYDLVMEVDIHSKESGQGVAPQMVGSLTFKCVGEDIIDDARHLWIEARMDVTDDMQNEHSTTLKVLVAADQIVDGEVSSHIVRGWCLEEAGVEPRAMMIDDDKFDQEPAAFALMHVFPDSQVSSGRREARTLTVDGEEIELTHCETGDLPRRNLDGEMVGEAVWWPSDDHAFGIAAADLEWTIAMEDEAETTVIYTSTMILAEQGTEAESDLPDHN